MFRRPSQEQEERTKEIREDSINARAAASYALRKRQEAEARRQLSEGRNRLGGWST